MFFQLSTGVLWVGLFVLILSATTIGLAAGTRLRDRSETLREPFAVLQGALVGFMALVIAFGLSLAVGRYEARRAAVVTEANTIGTTYLRAQTLAEPDRSQSLALLTQFTDTSILISETIPGSAANQDAVAASGDLQRRLWAVAAHTVDKAPTDTAPRLYLETLNETFDAQSSRVYGLSNRVPTPVLWLEVAGASMAMALLGLHLGTLGRGMLPILLAALLVSITLVITFDLDRPTRGLIQVPALPLTQVRASMDLPPAAPAPAAATIVAGARYVQAATAAGEAGRTKLAEAVAIKMSLREAPSMLDYSRISGTVRPSAATFQPLPAARR